MKTYQMGVYTIFNFSYVFFCVVNLKEISSFTEATETVTSSIESSISNPQTTIHSYLHSTETTLQFIQTSDISDTKPMNFSMDSKRNQTRQNNKTNLLKSKIKFSETIKAILEHYKQPDPLGIPGIPIPDPMDIPDLKKSFSFGRMFFKNVKLYGLEKFRIDYVVANVSEMKVEACLSIDQLTVKGDYTLTTWLSKANGPFIVKLYKVKVTAIATVVVEQDGILQAQDMDTDVKFDTIDMDFQNLGFFANMFQGMMNTVGSFVFDSIKPFVLTQINTNIRDEINKETKKLKGKFSSSISPVDQLIFEVRRSVRSKGYDPFYVPDYNTTIGLFEVHLAHTWLLGLSSFQRTKEIKFELRDNVLHMFLEISTGKLAGTTNWDVSMVRGSSLRDGTVTFNISYLKVQIDASQSMDTSRPPSLDDIQLELGNIQMRFKGLGSVDYLIEFGVNIIPNLLRYQIMDAIERPVKFKIQEVLNRVSVERIIMENVDQLDSNKGFEGLNIFL